MSEMKRCSAAALRNVTQQILEATNTRSDVAARVAAILVNAGCILRADCYRSIAVLKRSI